MLSNSLNVFLPFEFLLSRIIWLDLYPIFNWIICSNFLSYLYILEISPLSDVGLLKIFFHSVSYCFALLTTSFALQKLLSFWLFHLLIVVLSVCATGIIFRKWSSVTMYSRLLPTSSSIKFSVTEFMLMSLIHLNLSFVHSYRYGSIYILLHPAIQL